GQEGHSWQCLRCPVVRCRPHSRLCTGGAGLLRAAVGLAEYAHAWPPRSEEHTSELQSLTNFVCRLLLEKKNNTANPATTEGRTAGQSLPPLAILAANPIPERSPVVHVALNTTMSAGSTVPTRRFCPNAA